MAGVCGEASEDIGETETVEMWVSVGGVRPAEDVDVTVAPLDEPVNDAEFGTWLCDPTGAGQQLEVGRHIIGGSTLRCSMGAEAGAN